MNLNKLGLIETDNADLLIARMRHQRNLLLAASDWTRHMDARTNMGCTRAAGMIVMVIILAAIAVGAIVSIVEN